MPRKNPEAERFGGPGSSSQDRAHPEKSREKVSSPEPGSPTNSRSSKVSGGGANGTSIILTIPATEAEPRPRASRDAGRGGHRWKARDSSLIRRTVHLYDDQAADR